MNHWSTSFDRLHVEFPFLAWPRVTVSNAKYEFAARPGYTIAGYDFNFTQIFITNVERGEDPITDTLRRHLRVIEHCLRRGVRFQLGNPDAQYPWEATCTGGILWWAEQGVDIERPRLAVFRGRGLRYVGSNPIHDIPHGQYWLSDVGLLPC